MNLNELAEIGRNAFYAGVDDIGPLALSVHRQQWLAATEAIIKAASEWQPIETAPQDGTEILLCNAELRRQGVGSWGIGRVQPGPEGYRVNQGRPTWLTEDRTHQFPKPTHWQPLQEFPK